jgi:trypsin
MAKRHCGFWGGLGGLAVVGSLLCLSAAAVPAGAVLPDLGEGDNAALVGGPSFRTVGEGPTGAGSPRPAAVEQPEPWRVPASDSPTAPADPPREAGEVNLSPLVGWNVLMAEDFEGGFPTDLWLTWDDDGATNGEFFWDDDDFKPYSGSWSAWPANGGADGLDPEVYYYPYNANSWMAYGPIDLSGYTAASLDFMYWNQSELNYDWFFWGASSDGVNFSGYHVSGDSGGWVDQSFDLAAWLGDSTVWIAFVFQSDDTIVDDGPFVDDITLNAYDPGSGPGFLRVTSSPAVPSQILVDAIPRDTWGLTWLTLPAGQYEVSFTDVQGFETPTAETVTVTEGLTTQLAGSFSARAMLRVMTDPAVPSTISVDGVPRNDWGMWTDLPAGDYQVCFGEVPGYITPACQTATLTAGALTTITGTFAPSGMGGSALPSLGEVEPRIVGGVEVSPEGKYPFIVTVFPGPYICGGALIADSWVLTAAHCTEDIAVEDIDVVVGRHDLRETDGEVIGVTAKFEHPNYGTPAQWSNDFSLLTLASPAPLGSPITLADPGDVGLYPPGTMATVAGWGDTSWQGDLSPVLLEVDVPIVSDAACGSVYGSDFDGATMVCAGYDEGGKDPCQGDSGGPLFIDLSGSYLHIGVVSFGDQCALPGSPGVFAETSSAYAWIAATAGLQEPADGFLRVTSSPAVPSQILVDGIPRDTWGLTWVKLPAGFYEVSFTDVQGFTTPTSQVVSVNEGLTTDVVGEFVERGGLRVITDPAVPATISVDGVPRNDWGMWTDLPPGSYEVCFGDVPGYTTPACQTAVLTGGALTTITGNYSG